MSSRSAPPCCRPPRARGRDDPRPSAERTQRRQHPGLPSLRSAPSPRARRHRTGSIPAGGGAATTRRESQQEEQEQRRVKWIMRPPPSGARPAADVGDDGGSIGGRPGPEPRRVEGAQGARELVDGPRGCSPPAPRDALLRLERRSWRTGAPRAMRRAVPPPRPRARRGSRPRRQCAAGGRDRTRAPRPPARHPGVATTSGAAPAAPAPPPTTVSRPCAAVGAAHGVTRLHRRANRSPRRQHAGHAQRGAERRRGIDAAALQQQERVPAPSPRARRDATPRGIRHLHRVAAPHQPRRPEGLHVAGGVPGLRAHHGARGTAMVRDTQTVSPTVGPVPAARAARAAPAASAAHPLRARGEGAMRTGA